MKKATILITVLLLMSMLLSCQALDNNNQENEEENKQEFSYLPTYENMELISIEKAEADEGMDKGTYKVTDTTPEEFLTNYESYLIENGWEKTNDNKPVSINMEKEEHKAIVLIPSQEEQENDEITVIIFTV